MRADARRNRARVLTAAREAFAAEGAMVPLDEIARRAGVGAGTVYRHFPTKEALFEAVILDQLDQLAVDAKQALSTPDPGEGFFGFLDLLTADAATKKDLAEALIGAGVDLSSATRRSGAALYQALGELLARAQQAGVVRPDLDSADLHALIAGALAAEKHRADPTRPGRLNVLIFEALRPR
jgi:AcrR family transcriptional regulator